MAEFIHIDEETVKKLLSWDATFEATEVAMASVAKARAFQTARTFTEFPESKLLTMPAYLDSAEYGALCCKLITVCPNNAKANKPVLNATITLFDEVTGALKAIIGGTEITKCRTAAASAVATKYLTSRKTVRILAILGAGVQGESHALAFHHLFEFDEIRIWNRDHSKARKLVAELNQGCPRGIFKCFDTNEGCVRGADVVVTATFAPEPIVQLEWLKPNVHINAVGAGITHHSELSESIYLKSDVYIDHREGAEKELAGLKTLGVEFKGEIGGLITGALAPPAPDQITVFQSLGMGVEDCAMARMIYELHKKTNL